MSDPSRAPAKSDASRTPAKSDPSRTTATSDPSRAPAKSDPSLAGRVVLVTGGARGLGRAMALALASAGARLAITGQRQSAALTQTAEALAEVAGAQAVLPLAADVTDPEAAERAVAACLDRFGRLDVLVNNAGRGMRLVSERFNVEPTKFWQTTPEAWRAIVAANVDGPFLMARAALPPMLEAGFGKIINVSTSSQTMVRRGYAPYGPSKAFLEAASRIFAADLEGTGVSVNVLLPGGASDTEMLPPGPDRKGADGNLLPATVMDEAILWLASDASNGVSGGRFIARLWDGPEAARQAPAELPQIL